ncbi:MAG: dihydrolipoyl dehydrogenase [Pseudomonas fluorescens]|nr:MAG: dihydrolipoyl dehydrogenase [Pseudomonas fluorescens]
MSDKQFDVVVIGAGPGGYVAAIRASQLGFKTAIIERDALGGVCLNWGCIPTKALLKAAEVQRTIQHAADYGILAESKGVDFTKVIARSRDVAAQLSKGIGFLMKKHKIEVIKGTAKLTSDKSMEVVGTEGTQTVSFANAIIATGARAKQIKGVLEADGEYIWTAKEAMVPAKLPKTLLVIGAGAIGVEFASFYNALGVDVTIVEAQDRVCPAEDEEISTMLKKELEKFGIKFELKAKVEGLKADKGVTAVINGETRKFERAILAIGVTGNVENLGLENLKIFPEKGMINVDDFYRTSVPNIYAIGDVAGAPWLAHVASHEGVIAAETIAHKAGKLKKAPHPMRYDNIPGCTYCTPQVGSTGLTEQAAKAAGREVKIGRYPYTANGKALALGEPNGMVKTIFDAKTGELLGAHIIGTEATEMISTFVLGRSMEAVEEDFIHACLPHPTLSEMIAESVLASEGRALNG